jgi:hypothetical protein
LSDAALPRRAVDFGRALVQFGDMRCPALGAFLSAIEHGRQDFLETGGLEKAPYLRRTGFQFGGKHSGGQELS